MVQRALFSNAAISAVDLSRNRARRSCRHKSNTEKHQKKGVSWRDGAWSVAQAARMALSNAGGQRKGRSQAVAQPRKQLVDSNQFAAHPCELVHSAPLLPPSGQACEGSPPFSIPPATGTEILAGLLPAFEETFVFKFQESRALRAQRWERHVVAGRQYKAEFEAALSTLQEEDAGEAVCAKLLGGEVSPVGAEQQRLKPGLWSRLGGSPDSPRSREASAPASPPRLLRRVPGPDEFCICTPCKPDCLYPSYPERLALPCAASPFNDRGRLTANFCICTPCGLDCGDASSPGSLAMQCSSPSPRTQRRCFSICTPCVPDFEHTFEHTSSPGRLPLQCLSLSPLALCVPSSQAKEELQSSHELVECATSTLPRIERQTRAKKIMLGIVGRLLSSAAARAVHRRRQRQISAHAAALVFVLAAWHCDRTALWLWARAVLAIPPAPGNGRSAPKSDSEHRAVRRALACCAAVAALTAMPPWVHEAATILSFRRQPCDQRQQ